MFVIPSSSFSHHCPLLFQKTYCTVQVPNSGKIQDLDTGSPSGSQLLALSIGCGENAGIRCRTCTDHIKFQHVICSCSYCLLWLYWIQILRFSKLLLSCKKWKEGKSQWRKWGCTRVESQILGLLFNHKKKRQRKPGTTLHIHERWLQRERLQIVIVFAEDVTEDNAENCNREHQV